MQKNLEIVLSVDAKTGAVSGVLNEFEQLDSSAQKASDSISGLVGSIIKLAGTYVGLSAAREFIDMADAVKLVDGRLSLVTSTTDELTKAQNSLFSISQDTRQIYEDTADLYTRIARSTKDLGKSQEDTLSVTRLINESFVISGSAAESAKAAVIQLGQGFASGTLRGEELNSVLEQAPRLAEAIAKGMGVSVGQLKQLGESGSLTAKAVYEAILAQGSAIDAEFGKMPKTVEQASIQAKNSIQKMVSEFDKATGVTKGISDAITGIAKNIDTNSAGYVSAAQQVAQLAKVLAEAAAAYYTVTAASKAYTAWQVGAGLTAMLTTTKAVEALAIAQKALNLAMLASPWGVVAAGAVVAYEGLSKLNEAENERLDTIEKRIKAQNQEPPAPNFESFTNLGTQLNQALIAIDTFKTKLAETEAGTPQFVALQGAIKGIETNVENTTAKIIEQNTVYGFSAIAADDVAITSSGITTEMIRAAEAARSLMSALNASEAGVEKALIRAQVLAGTMTKAEGVVATKNVSIQNIDKNIDALIAANKKGVKVGEEFNAEMNKLVGERLNVEADAKEKLKSMEEKAARDKEHSAKKGARGAAAARKAALKEEQKDAKAAAAAYEEYLRATMSEEDYKYRELGNKLNDLGKYLTSAQLAEIYEAEVKKMHGTTMQFTDQFKTLLEGIFSGDFSGAFTGFLQGFSSQLMEPMVKSLSDGLSAAVSEGIGSIGLSGDIFGISGLGAGLIGVGLGLVSSMLSDTLSEAEIAAAKGRTDFSDESLENLKTVFESAQNPLLHSTRQMTKYLASMDKNFVLIGKAMSVAGSAGVDLTGADYKPSQSGGIWSSTSREMLSTGVIMGEMSYQSFNDGLIRGYTTELVTKSKYFGLSTKQYTKETVVDLTSEQQGYFREALQDGYDMIFEAIGTLGLGEYEDALKKVEVEIGKIDLEGLSPEEASQRIEAAFSEYFSQVLGGVATVDSYIDRYAYAGEDRLETIGRMAETYEQASDMFSQIGMDFANEAASGEWVTEQVTKTVEQVGMFGNTVTEAVTDTVTQWVDTTYTAQLKVLDIVEAAGGQDAFNAAMQSYVENFYSTEEQMQMQYDSLLASTQELGVSMPKNADEFKALWESIDVSTEAGAQLKGELLALNPQFANLYEQQQALADAEQALADARTSAMDNFIGSFYSTEEQIGVTAASLQNSMNELGLAMPKNADEFKNLVDSMAFVGETGETTKDKLLALAPEFSSLYSMQDELIAQEKQLADERAAAMQTLIDARNAYLPAADITQESIGQAIASGSDSQDVLSQIDTWANAEKDRLKELEQTRIDGINAEIEASNALRDSILSAKESATETLRSYTIGTVSQSQALLSQAINNGDYAGISGAYQNFAEKAQSTARSESEFISMLAAANADIQSISTPPEQMLLENIDDTLLKIDDSVNSAAVKMIDALIAREDVTTSATSMIDTLLARNTADTVQSQTGSSSTLASQLASMVAIDGKTSAVSTTAKLVNMSIEGVKSIQGSAISTASQLYSAAATGTDDVKSMVPQLAAYSGGVQNSMFQDMQKSLSSMVSQNTELLKTIKRMSDTADAALKQTKKTDTYTKAKDKLIS